MIKKHKDDMTGKDSLFQSTNKLKNVTKNKKFKIAVAFMVTLVLAICGCYATFADNVIYNEECPQLKVIKLDRSNDNPIKGAVYTLKEKESGEVVDTFTTDETGALNIYGIKKDIPYILKEKKAPPMFKISNITYNIIWSGDTITVTPSGRPSSIDSGTMTFDVNDTSSKKEPFVITDAPNQYQPEGAFVIRKIDGDTKEKMQTSFRVYDENNYQDYLQGEEASYDTVTTDADGRIELNDNAVMEQSELIKDAVRNPKSSGLLYFVEEAPSGYLKAPDIKFEITVDDNDLESWKFTYVDTGKELEATREQLPNGKNEDFITISNYKVGEVRIVKTDGSTGKALNEAAFQLTGETSDGNKIEEIAITNEFGAVIFKNIPTGHYQMIETQQPPGYKVDETKYDVFVSGDGTEKTFTHNGMTVKTDSYVVLDGNQFLPTKNIDADDDGTVDAELYYEIKNYKFANVSFVKTNTSTGEGLSGAEFLLDGVSGEATDDQRDIVTDAGVMQITGLKKGLYKLYETKAPEGFEISEMLNQENGFFIKVDGVSNKEVSVYRPIREGETETDTIYDTKVVKLTSDNEDFMLGTEEDPCYRYELTNEQKDESYNFSLYKTDEDGSPLKDAIFNLKGSTDVNGEHKDVDITATSDEHGRVKFENIPLGYGYKLTEVKSPSGHLLIKEPWTVNVTKRTSAGLSNGLPGIVGGVTIIDSNGNELSSRSEGFTDTGYGLFFDNNFIGDAGERTISGCTEVKLGKDNKVVKGDCNVNITSFDPLTSDYNSIYSGDYKNIPNYVKDDGVYKITGSIIDGNDVHEIDLTITIDSYNDIMNLTALNPEYSVTNRSNEIKVHFVKTDEKTFSTNLLEGAEFKLTGSDLDGNAVDTSFTSTDSNAITITLKPGTYKLTETKAPVGHDLASGELEIKITEYGEIELSGSSELAKLSELINDGSTGIVDENGDQIADYIKVINVSGIILPKSGGIGLKGIILAAALLIALGLGHEIKKKNVERRKKMVVDNASKEDVVKAETLIDSNVSQEK